MAFSVEVLQTCMPPAFGGACISSIVSGVHEAARMRTQLLMHANKAHAFNGLGAVRLKAHLGSNVAG